VTASRTRGLRSIAGARLDHPISSGPSDPRVPPNATQPPGDQLIDHARLLQTLGTLAQNPRVRVVSLGRTEAGADIPLVAVGEPAVVADLAGTCRRAAAYYQPVVAHPTWAAGDAAEPTLAALPLANDVRWPVLIEGGTFGFEASHTEGLLEAIDYLATADDAEARRVRARTVALFVPMANPDGRERSIRQWRAFPRSAGQDGSGNAYGFTVNRDFFHLATPEATAVLRAAMTYQPLVCLDTHEDMFLLGVEYAETCFCPPHAPGHNAEADPAMPGAVNQLGAAIARRWREAGFPLLHRDDGDHGYLAPPRPEDRGAKVSTLAGLDGRMELVLQLHGLPTLITESARTPGTQTWADRNGQKRLAALAVLAEVAQDPEPFVRAAAGARRRAIEAGRGRGFAVPLRRQSPDALAELLRILLAHDLQVYRGERPEPAYLVPQAQPAGRVVEALLAEAVSKQAALGPRLGLRILDLAREPATLRRAYQTAPLGRVTLPPAPPGVSSAPGRARPRTWTLACSRDGIAAVNRALARVPGSVRRVARGPGAGGFVLTATPLEVAQAARGLHVAPAESRGPVTGLTLRLPRTGLYAGQGVNERPKPYLAGVRLALDRFRFPYTLLEEADVTAAGLGTLDVLVVPGGHAPEIVSGWSATGIGRTPPWRSAGRSRGIGARGLAAIREFVRRGGTYVGIGSGGGLLAGPAFLALVAFEVVAATLGVGRVRLRVPDPGHPLVLGLQGSPERPGRRGAALVPAMYYSEPFARLPGGPIFRAGRGVTAVAAYAGVDADPASSTLIHPEVFAASANHAAILHRRVGRGQVCVFGIEPTFRGAWWSTATLLANALYLPTPRPAGR
jgi:hypothetical protein